MYMFLKNETNTWMGSAVREGLTKVRRPAGFGGEIATNQMETSVGKGSMAGSPALECVERASGLGGKMGRLH